MKALDVKLSDKVVVYDNNRGMQSSRLYWMFRVYGHQNVSILNGGINKWMAEKKPVVSSGSTDEKDFDYQF